MSEKDNQAKDAAMDLAEDSREKSWELPSFTAELFRGNFRWDLMHPFPVQSEEDQKIGDDLLKQYEEVFDKAIDPIKIDEEQHFPEESKKALAEMGAFGMKISKEYGGLGLSQTNYARALHYMGSYCQNTVTWVSAHQSIGVPQPLKIFGTEEQKKKFLPRFAAGEISAFALTEPDVGSDPAKMSTTAEPTEDGEHYILNGEKLWCTNGPDSNILVVMAVTPPKIVNGKERKQISAFIVETDTPGFRVEKRCKFMGLRGLSNGLLVFENVKVPKENLIGKPGEGLRIALTTLNAGRLGIPAASTGTAKRLVQDVEGWVNNRVQWGVPVGKHQSIARKISLMAANTFAMDSVVWLACAFVDKGAADIRLEAAIAKYFCTETIWNLMDDYIQVRGGRGFEREISLHNRGDKPLPAERFMRDLRVGRIFEGSTEVMHLIIAREAMDTHFSRVMPLLMPNKFKSDKSKGQLVMEAIKFYASWYPKMWLPSGQDFGVKHLNAANQDHLAYVDRTCRKLARTLFHTMGKYQAKLEFEQLILGNFVDIGVGLFTMAASLAQAEARLAKNPSEQTPQDLADLYCREARKKINDCFKAIGDNHNHRFDEIGGKLMNGELRWLINDIYTDVPVNYRDYADNQYKAPAKEASSESEEPVPAK